MVFQELFTFFKVHYICPGSLILPRVKINIPLCYHKALVGKRSIGVVFQKLLTTVPWAKGPYFNMVNTIFFLTYA
jgi:hypothetical protein